MLPNEFVAVGDRWDHFGAVGDEKPAISAILVHSVSVREGAYWYAN